MACDTSTCDGGMWYVVCDLWREACGVWSAISGVMVELL